LKAKFSDSREQDCPMRDGASQKGIRREVGVVWDNDGKLTFRFAKELEPAIVKALGGKAGDRVFFDLFQSDSDGKGRAPKADDDDADF
jgi:hypothetical protein